MIVRIEKWYFIKDYEDDGLSSGSGVHNRHVDLEALPEDAAPHRGLDLLLLALLQGVQWWQHSPVQGGLLLL